MRLQQFFDEQELDDASFAELVGVDRSTISRVRRGEFFPSWKLAAKIRSATGGKVTADDFLRAEPAE